MPRLPSLHPLRQHAAPVTTALVGCGVFLLWMPPTTDLANTRFRVQIFGEVGISPWNNQWFAGHHTPGYSLIAPPLGWVFGVVLAGVLGVLVASLLFSVLAYRLVVEQPSLRSPGMASVLFALGCLASLFGGRIGFAIATAFGVGALLAAVSDRWLLTGLLALFTAATNPVAGVFLALLGCALALSRAIPRPAAIGLAAPPLALLVAEAWLFPDGGDFPFPLGGVVNVLLITAAVAYIGWRYSTVRWACLGYAALTILSALGTTPMGGNTARFAALAALPVVALTLRRPQWWLVVVAIPLLVFQWSPVSLALSGDRAQTETSFYAPLMEVLATQPQPIRVEVVPLATHDEAYVVASQYPIARGWNRQLDRRYNALFSGDQLTAESYRAWLVENGISYVAIADAELDQGGELEAALLADPPPYLRLVHADDRWRVFEVLPRPAMAEGATVTEIGVDTFTLDFAEPGEAVVKVHFSPWFQVVEGAACVADNGDGWSRVVATEAGTVTVEAVLSWRSIIDRDGDC